MAQQQLDLFGNPITIAQPKKQKKELSKSAIEQPQTIAVVVAEPTKPKSKRGRPRKLQLTEPKTIAKRGRKSFTELYAHIDLVNLPSPEKLQEKLYHSITDVAKWFNITASQLRTWEKEFDILQPRKNKKGDRLFRAEDIEHIKTIYYLLRNKKMSMVAAKDHLKNNMQTAEQQGQIVERLQKLKQFLIELKQSLA